jgi:ribosomal protein S24E
MKMDVVSEKKNPLLHRTEMEVSVEAEGATPSRAELQKLVAAKKGVAEGLVVVESMQQEFGRRAAKAFVKVYESEKARAVEQEHVLARHQPKKKKEEAPAEAPKK